MPRHRYLIYSSSCVHNAMLGVFLLFAALMASATANAKFKSFDLPDGQLTTYPYSINNNGDIAGYYLSSKDWRFHGFVRLADGTIRTFEAQGSGTGNSQGTYAFSINDDGAITGSYTDDNFYAHGFVRKPNGRIVEFDAGGDDTSAMSINAKGWVTGSYNTEGVQVHGFLRAPDGTVTTLGLPSQYPQPLSINNKRRIAGWYLSNYAGVGFLMSFGGRVKTINCPNAASTIPQSVNDEDFVAGDCGGSIQNGFFRRSDGTFIVFHPPGAISTQALSINSGGDTAGWYKKGFVNGPAYGFVRFADGKMKTFSVRGAGTGANQGTYAQAINSTGIITGLYFDSQNYYHGFFGTP